MNRPSFAVIAVIGLATLFSTPTWATDSFRFLVEPSDSHANQGAVVTLYCTVTEETDRIMWVRDTAVITQNLQVIGSADQSDRYSIWYDVLTYNLVINGVVAGDAGSYKCVAFSGGNGIISRSARLEVSYPPVVEYPTLTSNIAGDAIAAGETIEISCEVEGGSPVPEVELIRGGETLVVASAQLVYVWVTDEGDDGAVFECRAAHPLWSDRRSAFLGPFSLVTEPPQATLAPASAEIQIDGTVSFICSASSAPRAVYRWFLNDVEQVTSADQSVVVHTTATVSLLHLRGSRDTNGVVRCRVEAASGDTSAESSLVLIITEISTSPPTTQPRSTEKTSTPVPSTTTPALPTSSQATTHGHPQPEHTTTPAPTTVTITTETPRQTDAITTHNSGSQTDATTKHGQRTGTAATSGQTRGNGTVASTRAVSDARSTDGTGVTDEGGSRDVPGASSFDTIFVITVSTIVSLVAVILIAVVGAFCFVTVKRRRKSREAMYAGSGAGSTGSGSGDVFFRSRYISIMRSWFSPVHRDTHNTLTSFAPPTPDQSPYNTVNKPPRDTNTPAY